MELLDKISFGFDIATAISIIGAVVLFIQDLKKQNTKKLEGEQEAERVKILMEVQQLIGSITHQFMADWGPGSKGNMEEKEKVLLNAHTTIIDLYNKYMPIIPAEDLNYFNPFLHYNMETFNGARYLVHLVEIDKSLIHRIRLIMNQETPEEYLEVIDHYINFRYKGYSELKKKIDKVDNSI